MANIWTIASYELRRLLRSRSMLINLFLLPILLIFLLGSALSGVMDGGKDQTIDSFRVGIVDAAANPSERSQLIGNFLKSPEVAEIITPETADSREAAVSGVRSGEYGYAVIVPAGFDKDILSGKEARLEYIFGKDRTDNMVAGTVFDNFLSSINYKQAAAMTLGPQAISAMTETGQGNPAVVLGKLNEGGPAYTASQYYAAAMLLMFLLLCGQMVITSLYSEKDNHTLFRIGSMPVKGGELFMGKMLGIGIVSVLQCAFIIVATRFLFGVYWGNRPEMLALVCLLMILASLTLSVLISMFVRTAALARSILSGLTVVMTFISGGMAPLPDSWVNTGGAFSINHWGMRGILRMMLESPWAQISGSITMLALICLVLGGVAFFSYRKVGYHA
ncbi:ABC-2 type transport system permease protein [Paenibacillus sophorae]|uniref:ABC transporter permease n=1 Tax=Paenibacillus sophorae TaxID=1333845 RepID=A0A1H8I3I8_9BACL|nr:ABC transporter permease [Paenibacillus sophorae]QWU15842.1 ABC transporter permease [Paenibacillus sophorae]SEN63039.1 ABC-2 type transport system permease protein [Paenibacillus sophorae]